MFAFPLSLAPSLVLDTSLQFLHKLKIQFIAADLKYKINSLNKHKLKF